MKMLKENLQKNRYRTLRILSVLLFIVILSSKLIGANSVAYSAPTILEHDYDHMIVYSKEGLWETMDASITLGESGRESERTMREEIDLLIENNFEEDYAELVEDWVSSQLETKYIVEVVNKLDGCFAIVTMDKNTYELSVIALNPDEETHSFGIKVENDEIISATVNLYQMEEISSVQLGASSIDDRRVSKVTLGVSSDTEETTEEEIPEEELDQAIVGEENTSEIKLTKSEDPIFDNASDGVGFELHNGVGIATFNIPSLFSVPLPAQFTGGTILNIYGDGLTEPYATWSGDALPKEYLLTQSSVINIVSASSGANRYNMQIDFYNTQTVEIAQLNASTLTGTMTLNATGADSNFVINTGNSSGYGTNHAFSTGGILAFSGSSGKVTIEANNNITSGSSYHIGGNAVFNNSCFSLTGTASGQGSYGFNTQGTLSVSDAAEINVIGELAGVKAEGNITATSSGRIIGKAVTVSQRSTVFAGITTQRNLLISGNAYVEGVSDSFITQPTATNGILTTNDIMPQIKTAGVVAASLRLSDGQSSYDTDNKSTLIAKGGDAGGLFQNAYNTLGGLEGNRFYINGGAYAEMEGDWVGLLIRSTGGQYHWIGGDDYTVVNVNAQGKDTAGNPYGVAITSNDQIHFRKMNETTTLTYNGIGGRVTANGSQIGIYAAYIAPYHSVTITARGGVAPDYEPKIDPITGKTILPATVPNTYGVYAHGTYVATYHNAKLYAYGGEYGTWANSYVVSYHSAHMYTVGGRVGSYSRGSYTVTYNGSLMYAEGGEYGIISSTYWHTAFTDIYAPSGFTKSNNITIAIGGKVGLKASSTSNLDATAGNYLYAWGGEVAIESTGTVVAGNSIVVARRGLPEIPNDTGQTVETTASRPSAGGTISVATNALFHEILDVENFDIKSPPPVALNVKYNALKTTMGSNVRRTADYKWTTPVVGPELSSGWYLNFYPTADVSSYSFTNYDATDDQKFLKASQYTNGSGVTYVGLEALHSIKDVYVVADRRTTGSYGTGTVQGAGNHRITIMGVDVYDNRTMDVKIPLTEDLFGNASNNRAISSISNDTSFLLKYWPLPEKDSAGNDIPNDYTTPVKTVTIDSSKGLDIATKTITLNKLPMGEYHLQKIDAVGYPYKAHTTADGYVMFTLRVDTSDLTGAPLYPNWYEKVFLEATEPTASNARLVLAASGPGTGISTALTAPTIPQPDTALALMVPERHAIFNLLYEREKHIVDFKLIDADSVDYQLDGAFTLKAYPSSTDKGVSYTYTSPSRVNGSPAQWKQLELWAGLAYEMEQTTTQQPFYIKRDGTYKFELSTVGVLNETGAVQGYEGKTVTLKDRFSIVVTNELPSLPDIDFKLVDAVQLSVGLKGGKFEVYPVFPNGEEGQAVSFETGNNGTVKLSLKPTHTYKLKQTHAPTSYFARDKIYEFTTDVSLVGQFIVLNSVDGVNIAAGDGWETTSITGYDGKSIFISNIRGIGDMRIDLSAENIWKYHEDPIFLVKLEGTAGLAAGKEYYTYVKLVNGATIVSDLNTPAADDSGSVIIEDISIGTYTVTALPAMRFTGVSPQTITGIVIDGMSDGSSSSADFSFKAKNHEYLSDEQVTEYSFSIDFE